MIENGGKINTTQKQPLFYLLIGFLAGVIATKLVTKIAYEEKKDEDEWSEAWERNLLFLDFGV